MPELPEVETVCRGLALKLECRRFRRVIQRRPDLRFPLPKRFAKRLEGRRVVRVGRRAKYILIDLDDDNVVLAHLGMSGTMIASDAPLAGFDPHDHLVFETDDGTVIRFTDARRFGFMDLVARADLDRHRLLARRRRSSPPWSISGSLPGSATSMRPKACSTPASRPGARRGRCRATGP